MSTKWRLVALGVLAALAGTAFGQSEPKPSFEIADVHASAPSSTPYLRGPWWQGVRYELKTASMVELIAFAYGVDEDKVYGGPSWVEFDRFDVIAKALPNTPPEKLKVMLQSLLADRFKLVVHSGGKPFPGWAMSIGNNPKLKESDGSGQPGCNLRAQPSLPLTQAGRGLRGHLWPHVATPPCRPSETSSGIGFHQALAALTPRSSTGPIGRVATTWN
jgi:hypothetical protein